MLDKFSNPAADTAEGITEVRRQEALLKVGAERMLGYTAVEVVNKITPADISDPQEVIARAEALSLELGTRSRPALRHWCLKFRVASRTFMS